MLFFFLFFFFSTSVCHSHTLIKRRIGQLKSVICLKHLEMIVCVHVSRAHQHVFLEPLQKKQQPDHLPGSLPFSQISNTPYLRLVGSQSRHHSLWPLTSADDHSSDENYRLQEAADMWLPTKANTHRDDGWAPFYSESTESTVHFSGNLQHCLPSHWKDDSVLVLMRLWELIIHTTLWLTINNFTSCAFIAFASGYTSMYPVYQSPCPPSDFTVISHQMEKIYLLYGHKSNS